MITLEQARYLCHSDEPTTTRDLITAISEAEGVADKENRVFRYEITPSTSATPEANILLDYLMGHMRERDPTLFAFLRDWSWRDIESAIAHHPVNLPFHDSGNRYARGMQTQVVFGAFVKHGAFMGAREVTLDEIDQALESWLSLYRLYFQGHPAPSYKPLRRMVFLLFAVWPGVQHDMTLARTLLDPPRPSVEPPTTVYDLPLAFADVARVLPNASPHRPAPPLHVMSSGNIIVFMGGALGHPMRPVRMLLYYQEQHWRARYENNGLVRHNPLIQVWKTAIEMDNGLHDPNKPHYEAALMQRLWHTAESRPSTAVPPVATPNDAGQRRA